jgi:hypothetical protein
MHEKWAAWEAWEMAFHRFKEAHPDAAAACDDVFSESVPEIPNEPWESASRWV